VDPRSPAGMRILQVLSQDNSKRSATLAGRGFPRRLRALFSPEDRLDNRPDYALVGIVRVPHLESSPWRQIFSRIMWAIGAIILAVIITYAERTGYQDSNDPDNGMTLVDCIYYATVSLTTTGYGDITPITQSARLANVILITPLRLFFLIVLIGTTLQALTERSRQTFRIQRWRSSLRNHTVVIGYGTKGRSAVAAMLADDIKPGDIVVVDNDANALELAALKGLVTVHGSGTKADVLKLAGVTRAKSIIVATNIDDTAVLVTLSARELNPRATIVASIRESENAHLIEQSGADSVVVSAETTGRLLGLATVTPSVVTLTEDLLSPEEGFSVAERPVEEEELGGSPRHMRDLVLGVVRHGQLYRVNDSTVDTLEIGDRLLYVRMTHPTITQKED